MDDFKPFCLSRKIAISGNPFIFEGLQICIYLEERPEISRRNYIMLKSEVDLEATVQVCQVGAHFKALGKGVLVAPSDLRCIFFTSQTKPQERCGYTEFFRLEVALTLRNTIFG